MISPTLYFYHSSYLSYISCCWVMVGLIRIIGEILFTSTSSTTTKGCKSLDIPNNIYCLGWINSFRIPFHDFLASQIMWYFATVGGLFLVYLFLLLFSPWLSFVPLRLRHNQMDSFYILINYKYLISQNKKRYE